MLLLLLWCSDSVLDSSCLFGRCGVLISSFDNGVSVSSLWICCLRSGCVADFVGIYVESEIGLGVSLQYLKRWVAREMLRSNTLCRFNFPTP